MSKKKNDIRVHVNPKYFGNRLYVFTKDSNNCITVEYNPTYDFGKSSPSGAHIESVEIHTNNGFIFNEEWKEISLSEVPECIIELLTYLKVDCPTDEEVFEYARHISDEYEPSQPERDSMFTLERGTMFKITNYAKGIMSKPKVARTIEDARSWAASFSTSEKKESTVTCTHGTALNIEIMWKGQVTDSIIACRECWVAAPDWVRVD